MLKKKKQNRDVVEGKVSRVSKGCDKRKEKSMVEQKN